MITLTWPGFGSRSAPQPVPLSPVKEKSGEDDTTQPREERVRRQNRQAAREAAAQDKDRLGIVERRGASAI